MNNTLSGKLTSRGNLNGNVNTIVFAHNYNDLTNKPQINNVTLQGNKTASELGLATPSDITVTSVNEQTGDVILSGSDIDYSVGMSLNAKIDDLESQIHDSGVASVNGMTGNVTLTSNDINYSTGVTIKNKIDSVEGEIPVVDYPVTSVNGATGAVVLAGSDIEYSAGVSINTQIDNVSGEISDLTGAGIPLTSEDSTKVSEAIGDLSDLTTSVSNSLVGAVNEVNRAKLLSMAYEFSQAINANSTYQFDLTRTTVSVPTGAKVKAVFLQERISSSVNGMFYSMSINETAENFAKGVILNPNSSNSTYYFRMTILYTY